MASSSTAKNLDPSSSSDGSWWREPLLHFGLIGAIIFGVSAFWTKSAPGAVETRQGVSRQIHLSESRLRELFAQFKQNEGHPPSSGELNKAADDWVHDEVLYREGLIAGLDRNDPVIRQRLVKLMQWYLVGASSGGEPGESEMRQHFEANQERYRSSGGLAFEQVFFSTKRRGPTAETDARMTLRSFEAGTQTGIEVAIGHGDSMGGDKSAEELQRGKQEELAAKFGAPFVALVEKLPLGKWAGPYQSPIGWHVVKHGQPSNPTFEELRAQIRSEIIASRGSASPEAAFQELRRKYDVEFGSLPEVQK